MSSDLQVLNQPLPLTSPQVSKKYPKKEIPFDIQFGNHQKVSMTKNSYLIGLSGGDCAGKKLMIKMIIQKFKQKNQDLAVLQEQSFYKWTDQQRRQNPKSNSVFLPDNINWVQFEKSVASFAIGNKITVRQYDYIGEKLTDTYVTKQSKKICLVVGIHLLGSKKLRELFDICVFLESDSDIRLSRRVYQDTKVRGVPLEQSIKNYLDNIKPNFQKYTEPTKKYADILIPRFGGGYSHGGDINDGGFQKNWSKGVDLITDNLFSIIERSQQPEQVMIQEHYNSQKDDKAKFQLD